MYTTQSLDLHVRGLIRMRGGVIFREPTTAVTDIMGYVAAKLFPNSKRMYILEAGLYIVYFEEAKPKDITINSFARVEQHDLNMAGALLTIGLPPSGFEGTLQVFHQMQIEENSKLGTLIYRTFPDLIAEPELVMQD